MRDNPFDHPRLAESLVPDMAAFDEEANPWRAIPAEEHPALAAAFLQRWTDAAELRQAFPQLGQCYFPFMEPRRQGQLAPGKQARNLAKGVVQMHTGLPRHLLVEATARCNLGCPFCSSHSILARRRKDTMELADFLALWRHAEHFTHSLDFTGGEPLLNPDLPAMIQTARNDGVYVGVHSNALLLTPDLSRRLLDAGLNNLIVSLDGVDAERYRAARPGGDFALLRSNIAAHAALLCRENTGKSLLGVRIVVTRQNLDAMDAFWSLARDLGADFALLRHYRLPPDAPAEERALLHRRFALPPEHPDSAYDLDVDSSVLPLKTTPGCTRSRHPAYVGSGGEVLPCMFFLRDQPFGNAVHRPFAEVWLHPESVTVRRETIRRGRDSRCSWCPGEYRENWFLERWF